MDGLLPLIIIVAISAGAAAFVVSRRRRRPPPAEHPDSVIHCPSCGEHIRVSERRCPYCDAPNPRAPRR